MSAAGPLLYHGGAPGFRTEVALHRADSPAAAAFEAIFEALHGGTE